MNADKRGRPYLYPEPLIAWTACIHISLQTPYRQMEDFVRKLATFIPGLVAADYTTLFRWIQHLDLSLKVTTRTPLRRRDHRHRQYRDQGHEPGRVDAGEVEGQARLDQGARRNRRQDQPDPWPGGSPTNFCRMTGCLSRSLTRCRSTAAKSIGYTGCPVMGPTTKTSSSMSSNNGGSSQGQDPDGCRDPPYRAGCARDRIRWGEYQMWSAGNHLRGAVEDRRELLQRQTVLRRRSAGNVSRGGVLREVRMKMNYYNILVTMAA